MPDLPDVVNEELQNAKPSRLNSWIAIVVAVSATIMALGNVKDGNIVQAMAQAQASAVDQWSYFQAKSTKEHLAELAADQFTVQRAITPSLAPEAQALLDRKIAEYQARAKQYALEKVEIKKVADGLQAEYDRLNYRDDQFDMAEACLALCIALLGISALTQKRWLFGFAFGLSLLGMVFELAAFAGLHIHPDFLAKLLS